MLKTLAAVLLAAATAGAQVSTVPPGASGAPAFAGGTITTPLLSPTDCASPAYAFTDDADAGMCLSAADSVRVQTAPFGTPSSSQLTLSATQAALWWNNGSDVLSDITIDTGGVRGFVVGKTAFIAGSTAFTVGGTADFDTLAIAPVAKGAGSNGGSITSEDLDASRIWTLPNASGAIVLTPSAVPILAADGTAGAPSFSFSTTPTAGMYVAGTNTLGWSTSSTLRLSLSTAALTSTLPILHVAGTVGAPGIAFASTPTLGFYDIGSNQLALAASGATPFVFQGAYVNTSGQYGFSANPAGGAPDAGFARGAAARLKVTDGGAGGGNLGIDSTLYFGSGLDTQLIRIAAAHLRVGDLSTGPGYLTSGQLVEANTGTKSPTVAEAGELYTNTGDTDGSIINLPNDPTIGTQFRVALTVAQTVTINAAAGESIQDAGTNAASRSASAIGDTIHLIAVTGGSGAVWMVVSKTGTWT